MPGLLQCDDGKAFATILDALEGAGYDVSWETINARCISPQSRNRLYFVGLRRQGAMAGQQEQQHAAKRPRCEGEAESASGGANAAGAAPAGGTFEFPYIPDLQLRADDILKSNSSSGGGSADTSEMAVEEGSATLTDGQWERFTQGTVWRRRGASWLAWGDTVCNAVISHYGQDLGGNSGNTQLVPGDPPCNPRAFSPREAARLQGFPDSFRLLCVVKPAASAAPGEESAVHSAENEARRWQKVLYRLVGNAVCAPVIATLGGAIVAQCPALQLRGENAPADVSVQAPPDTACLVFRSSCSLRDCLWLQAAEMAAVGLGAGLLVAVEAVAPHRRAAALRRWEQLCQ